MRGTALVAGRKAAHALEREVEAATSTWLVDSGGPGLASMRSGLAACARRAPLVTDALHREPGRRLEANPGVAAVIRTVLPRMLLRVVQRIGPSHEVEQSTVARAAAMEVTPPTPSSRLRLLLLLLLLLLPPLVPERLATQPPKETRAWRRFRRDRSGATHQSWPRLTVKR